MGLRQRVQLLVRILRAGDGHRDGRRLAARRGLDGRGAGLRAGGDHARAHHVRDRAVRARPRDLPVRRVVGPDRRGQLHGRARLQAQLPAAHAVTRDRDGRDRDGGLALDRGQGRGGAVPLHDAAVVVQARLAGSRILLAAAVVEDHLRALGEAVRDHVLVQVGLLAAVGRARGGHLHARPGRVVRRGRAVARVHVRVDLAPARGLGGVDGVVLHRIRRKLARHRNRDRRGLGPGLRGDRGLAGLPRGDHALRADGRHVLVGRAPAHGRALRIGRGGQLLRGHALGQVHAVIRLINLNGLGLDNRTRTTDVGHLHREHIVVGLLIGVIHLRSGVRQVGVVIHRQIVRQGIHGGQTEGGRQFDADATRSDALSGGAKLLQRNGDLIMIVHVSGIVALLIEVDPLGIVLVVSLHIADHTTVAFAPAAVDADDILAQNAVAVAELDAGLLGVGLGIGCRTIRGVGVQAGLIALVDPRAVGTVGGNGHHIVKLLLATPGDVGRPQGTAGLQTTVVADTGAVILGVDGNVERQVLGLPQVALAQRVVVASVDDILHVGHFPHEVQVVVIIGAVQRVQIDRNLIHGIRTVHARIVVGGTLRNQHGTIPIGNACVLASSEVNGLLHAVADFVGAVLRGEVLRRHLHFVHGHLVGQRGTLLDVLDRLGSGARHGDCGGLAHGQAAANGDDVSILECAGLAFGRRVLQVASVHGMQSHLHAVSGEVDGCRFGGNVRQDLALDVEDADRIGFGGAGFDLAVLDYELAAIDLIRIGSVVKVGGHASEILLTAHVGDGHTIVRLLILGETLDHEAGLVSTVLQILALAIHGVAEVVDRHNGRVLPHVVAGVTQFGFLGELRPDIAVGILTARFLRTVEIQRCSSLAGADNRPTHHELVVGQLGGNALLHAIGTGLFLVGVVIVGFDPCHKLVLVGTAGADALHHLGAEVAGAYGSADGAAIRGGGVAAAIGGFVAEHIGVGLVVKAGIALQDLAVLELGTVVQNGVPIVRLLVVEDFARQLDVLGRIVTETVNTIGNGGLQEALHAVGHGLVLCVQIPQAEQVALRDLITVGVILDLTVGTITAGALVEVVGVLPVGVDGEPVGGEVVGHHVHDDAHAVFVGGGGHFFQIILRANHEVADGGVRRLIDVVPVLVELLAVGRNELNLAHRLGLHGGVASLGDGFHVRRDVLERPHPRVQDGAVLHVLGQAILLTGRFERRISDGVLVAVTIGGKCGGCHTHTAEQRGDRHRSRRYFLPGFGRTSLAGRAPALCTGHQLRLIVVRRLFSGECVRHTRERMSAESHLTLPASLHLRYDNVCH